MAGFTNGLAVLNGTARPPTSTAATPAMGMNHSAPTGATASRTAPPTPGTPNSLAEMLQSAGGAGKTGPGQLPVSTTTPGGGKGAMTPLTNMSLQSGAGKK